MTSPPSLRIVFAGTPEFAASHLDTLINSGKHEVIAVYTQPDRPSGRGKKLTASPVKQRALAAELPVFQPSNFRAEADRQQLAELQADLMVVVAYGLILPQAVLDIPRLGCINVHASLLPRWRGAAPIQRAIEAGDSQSGITIMQMDAGLDTGAMLLKTPCAIEDSDTAADLHDRLARLGGPALLAVVEQLACGTAHAETQDDSQSSYAAKIDKAEALIDWHQPATEIARKIRAFNPFPICHTLVEGERCKIWRARPMPERGGQPGCILRADSQGILVACGEGSLLLEELQLPGARRLAVRDLLNARAALFTPGSALGQHA